MLFALVKAKFGLAEALYQRATQMAARVFIVGTTQVRQRNHTGGEVRRARVKNIRTNAGQHAFGTVFRLLCFRPSVLA